MPSRPSEIDLSQNFQNTFGEMGLEKCAVQLVKFLANPDVDNGIQCHSSLAWSAEGQIPDTWKRQFTMNATGIEPVWFAIMCAGGWIQHTWFPKGSFQVTEAFVNRVCEKWGKTR